MSKIFHVLSVLSIALILTAAGAFAQSENDNNPKGVDNLSISEFAKNHHDRAFPDYNANLAETDPEFFAICNNFALDDVIKGTPELDDKTRFMAILAVTLGCQGLDYFKFILPAALNVGVTPVEAKEIVYQANAYLGISRVYPFLKATNEILEARGVKLPLEPQSITTTENRREAGTQAQVDIFGESMRDFWKNGQGARKDINKWLAANCFGDYYTRKGLDLKQREMITFCYIMAQGGCEPQLIGHAQGNFRMGNDKDFLIKVVLSCVPYIGYPRSLNALRCIEEAAK